MIKGIADFYMPAAGYMRPVVKMMKKRNNVPIDKFNHGIDAARYAVLARALNRRRMVRVGSVGR